MTDETQARAKALAIFKKEVFVMKKSIIFTNGSLHSNENGDTFHQFAFTGGHSFGVSVNRGVARIVTGQNIKVHNGSLPRAYVQAIYRLSNFLYKAGIKEVWNYDKVYVPFPYLMESWNKDSIRLIQAEKDYNRSMTWDWC